MNLSLFDTSLPTGIKKLPAPDKKFLVLFFGKLFIFGLFGSVKNLQVDM